MFFKRRLKRTEGFPQEWGELLDARHAISVTERQRYILRVRTLARAVAQAYYDARLELGFPLADKSLADELIAAAKDAKEANDK